MIVINTEEEFDAALDKATTSVVVLFTAPGWCAPCRQFEPVYKAVSESASNEFDFLLVDVDYKLDNNQWALERFNIQSVPTAMLFNDLGSYVRDVTVPQNAIPFLNDIRS